MAIKFQLAVIMISFLYLVSYKIINIAIIITHTLAELSAITYNLITN